MKPGREKEPRSPLGQILAVKLWEFVERDLIKADLELLRITRGHGLEGGFGLDEDVTQLSTGFGALLRSNGIELPRLSVSNFEIPEDDAVAFIRDLIGVSPKGIFGEWSRDQRVFNTKNPEFKIRRSPLKIRTDGMRYESAISFSYRLERLMTAD